MGLPQKLGADGNHRLRVDVISKWRYCPRLSVIGDRTRGLDREVIKTEPGGEEQCTDVMKIDRPDDLADIADLGLTFAEAERLLGGLQQEIVAAQVRVMPFPGRTAEAVAAFAV